ncbi:MAG: hypothetical protein LUD47_07530 [Clostridia bacterium]|nr:hypothetical protein [Clostridia bacterium]
MKKALYTYTVDDEVKVGKAQFIDREVNGNVILLTFRIINDQTDKTHTINTVYLMYTSEDLDEIINDGDPVGTTKEKALGQFDVNTTVNGYQSFAVRVRVQYKETSEEIDEDTSGIKVTHIPWEE